MSSWSAIFSVIVYFIALHSNVIFIAKDVHPLYCRKPGILGCYSIIEYDNLSSGVKLSIKS